MQSHKTHRDRHKSVQRRRLPVAVPPQLHPMIATKLWDNPCWLSFRVNFLAHHFNQPVYQQIWQQHRLSMPEHVVLYAVALKEGITADDVSASSAKPKNTLSRAVNALIGKKLLLRRVDPTDGRRRPLFLSRSGRELMDATLPLLLAREQAMAAALTEAEQSQLDHLLTKLILGQDTLVKRSTVEETS
jgi:MarR family transcriptional regulator, temperature-dependent positive regulator of motility